MVPGQVRKISAKLTGYSSSPVPQGALDKYNAVFLGLVGIDNQIPWTVEN